MPPPPERPMGSQANAGSSAESARRQLDVILRASARRESTNTDRRHLGIVASFRREVTEARLGARRRNPARRKEADGKRNRGADATVLLVASLAVRFGFADAARGQEGRAASENYGGAAHRSEL
jgi:hypothetical protein